MGVSLTALLHETPDELLGVGLEHLVDLLQQRVDLGVAGLSRGGHRSCRLRYALVVRPVCPCTFLTSHGALLSSACPAASTLGPDPDRSTLDCGPGQVPASAASRLRASGLRSRSAPTCSRVPRNGSRIGTRCSVGA